MALAVAVVLTVLGTLAIWLVGPGRTPRDLRGDWWARFERDFRQYAGGADTERPAPDNRLRPHQ
jgi:hypothetical protein